MRETKYLVFPQTILDFFFSLLYMLWLYIEVCMCVYVCVCIMIESSIYYVKHMRGT